MALNPETEFPGQIRPSSTEYPLGQPRDVAVSLDNTGTPWNARLASDIFGFQQAILAKANLSPSGNPDTAVDSQYLQGLEAIMAAQVKVLEDIQRTIPIFPEVLTASNTVPVSAPSAGTVRVPAGIDILHNGSFTVTTLEQEFNTNAGTVYHLRWNATDGFQLLDVTDAIYNPNALPEGDESFDTTFNDMLVSRVVTSQANVADITNLVNKKFLEIQGVSSPIVPATFDDIFSPGTTDSIPLSLLALGASDIDTRVVNWSRRPVASLGGVIDLDSTPVESNFGVRALDRYEIQAFYQLSGNNAIQGGAVIAYSARA